MFCHSVGCLFILLMVFFAAKTFQFDVAHLFIFSFVSLAEEMYQKNILLQAMGFTAHVFFQEFFIILSLIFKTLIHFEFIFVCDVRRGLLSFFSMYLSNFPSINYSHSCRKSEKSTAQNSSLMVNDGAVFKIMRSNLILSISRMTGNIPTVIVLGKLRILL